MKLLLIYDAENDYGALTFDQQKEYTAEECAAMLEGSGKTKGELALAGGDLLTMELFDVGEVDPRMLAFIREHLEDEDAKKHKNFYVIG